ncbi:SulP family inorganic anion transporter [Planococcus sp. CP5-4]|uniref:SulP family inorganic anion transporter n=1 Tax=unclassified Planococcus (in: firmicutes) TaxID=2662419 RepID=UPI001C22E50B|nr:SulP family inorganic anion transporter [Planococcus sp. CP5-4]MBU9672402.1 SulP family inorganic anion transporter [Planococcus sp. CP5-4_YE]MBV0909453.1 SulP family inorganic anion transporter [Planococcus sp. CP5-4_UN]MBW6064182.1 SulP family inorganic anion transporter [Planococcus sp. CP5-4]
MKQSLKTQWFGNIRGDILSGILVAIALIPEAIAFSIIAGVDPMVGLYASFSIAVIIAFVGGRPGMISAATGAMALLMVPLVRDHGLEYLLAATILTGVIQLLFGVFKVAKVMKFIPRAVMIGFVNALAILIFMAQVPHFIGINTMTYVFVAITLAIIYIVPRFFKAIPAPLIALVVLTVVAIYSGFELRTVGDLGTISQTLPSFLLPDVPFNLQTLSIIFPYSLALAIVGLLESLLTANIVDDMTDTTSDKNKEARGQGIANFITGFFGGMAGCAMIGQSVINVKSGGRGRLSALVAGTFLMFLIIVLGNVVVQIPMPVLVGIMIMVSIGTFDWASFTYLKKAPKTDSIVMVATVAIVVYTHDLSIGVLAGVLLSAIFFVSKISKIKVEKRLLDATQYRVEGQLFFASVEDFLEKFDFDIEREKVVIDFTDAHIWDDSGVGAVDRVVLKFRENANEVEVTGLDAGSQKLVDQLAIFKSSNAKLPTH